MREIHSVEWSVKTGPRVSRVHEKKNREKIEARFNGSEFKAFEDFNCR